MVHRGEGEWDAPKMPNFLYHHFMNSTGLGRVQHANNRVASDIANHQREGRGNATGLDEQYLRSMEKVGLTQGMFTWACPMANSNHATPEVDEDWDRLTEAFLSNELTDASEAVIIRGPFDAWKVRPKMYEGKVRSAREEYKFHVMTKDFRDKEAIAHIHYTLRQLNLTSNTGMWVNYAPLFQSYLKWTNHPLYSCPPTGGEPLDRREAERWRRANGLHNMGLSRFAYDGKSLHERAAVP